MVDLLPDDVFCCQLFTFFQRPVQYTRPGQVMCFMCVMLTIYDHFACSLSVSSCWEGDFDRAGPGDRRMLR